MSELLRQDFKSLLWDVGRIVMDPSDNDWASAPFAEYVVFSESTDHACEMAMDWLKLSEATIICPQALFEKASELKVRPYRFRAIEQFQEFAFEGGYLVFIPHLQNGRSSKSLWESFALSKAQRGMIVEGLHVIVRGFGKAPVLHVCSEQMGPREGQLLQRESWVSIHRSDRASVSSQSPLVSAETTAGVVSLEVP